MTIGWKNSRPLRGLVALAFVVTAAVAGIAPARALETIARHAYLIDVDTGTVLFQKAADVPMPPASLTKLMTVYLIFEKLKNGTLHMDDKFPVSEKAWRMGGSKMFVKVGDRVSVHDLIQGIIVQSGNDACIVMAEGIAGSEAAFVQQMNQKARELGLLNSHFKNATGWPADGHVMSAHDIATLSLDLIRDFPQYYHFFSEINFTYNGIKQGNRNPLLYKNMGVDGLKTGHTEESGYSLAASAVRNGRRLLLVVNGLSSMNERSSEGERLLDWGFRATQTYALFKKGDVVDKADVWLGAAPTVPLVINRDLKITIPRDDRSKMTVKAIYTNPIPAPIKAGTPIARLVVNLPSQQPIEVPLVAGASVDRLGLFGRLNAAVKYLVWGAPG